MPSLTSTAIIGIRSIATFRRRGHSPADAEDVAQNFFMHLIEKQSLTGMQREGGKFRSFLLRSLDNFLANEWDSGWRPHPCGHHSRPGQPLVEDLCERCRSSFGWPNPSD